MLNMSTEHNISWSKAQVWDQAGMDSNLNSNTYWLCDFQFPYLLKQSHRLVAKIKRHLKKVKYFSICAWTIINILK